MTRRALTRGALTGASLPRVYVRGPTGVPTDQAVIRIEFVDAEPRERLFWLVVTPEKVDICIKSPGYPEYLSICSRVRAMVEVWRGIRSLRGALQNEDIVLEGSAALRRSFPRWFLLSAVAGVKSQRHRLQDN